MSRSLLILATLTSSPAFAGGDNASGLGPLGMLVTLAGIVFVGIVFVGIVFGSMAAAPFVSKEEIRRTNGEE